MAKCDMIFPFAGFEGLSTQLRLSWRRRAKPESLGFMDWLNKSYSLGGERHNLKFEL